MALISHLNTLEAGGLIYLAQTQPEAEYRFQHALVQEATYASLVKSDRKLLHGKVGSILEQLYPDRVAELAPLLGQHFDEAGADEAAIKYLSLAGDIAASRYANAEAIAHYTRAIELTQRNPQLASKAQHLFSQRGRALELSGRFQDALTNYEEMEAFALEHDDRSMRLDSLVARGTLRCTPTPVIDFALGPQLSMQSLTLARELGNRRAEATIYRNLMLLNNFAGNVSEAVQYGEHSLEIARDLGLREQATATSNDLFRPYASIGAYRRAQVAIDEARVYLRETNSLPMLADNLSRSARIALALGEYDEALSLAAEARQISERIGNIWGQSFCRMFVSYIHFERGDMAHGIQMMQECIDLGQQAGFALPLVTTRADLGWFYGTLGAIDRGLELAKMALQWAQQHMPTFQVWALACLTRLYVLAHQLDAAQATLNSSYELFTHDWAQNSALELPLADAELALAQKDYARALQVMDKLLTNIDQFSIRFLRADALYLKGCALINLNEVDQAYKVLSEAQAQAQTLGTRRILWKILAQLSDLESQRGHASQAKTLRDQARQTIDYIAAHCPIDLKETFLNLPDVQATL